MIVRDYKSGGKRDTWPSARWVSDNQVQVALYMIAVQRLLGVRAVAGFYQPLAGEDLRPRGVYSEGAQVGAGVVDRDELPAEELEQLLAEIEDQVVALAATLRRGELTPCPDTLHARRDLPLPRNLLGGALMQFTDEQTLAIERRRGELLLDAGAGSGKTSVLVERFARAVQEDGIGVGQILTITFTEKAAAELRERIRLRLREAGDDEAARATEGAWISTIHAFCARLLRTHALDAGLDPEFSVLDERETAPLRPAAFDAALQAAATDPGGLGVDLGLRPGDAARHDRLDLRRAAGTRRARAAAAAGAAAAQSA